MSELKAFRTVIAFPFPKAIDDVGNYILETQYLPIDYLEDRSVRASSKIVTQPLQNGDTMADHMYREPTTVDIKGKFSLNGRNRKNTSYNIMLKGDRLTNIEYVFEFIKNNGTLCTLTTVETDIDTYDDIVYDEDGNLTTANINPANTRFLTRENMALTNINWVEKVNTLEFNFSFTEVIMIDKMEFEFYDASDLDLPSLNEPQAQGVGTVLFGTGELPKIITQILCENGYVKSDWANAVVTTMDYVGTVFTVFATIVVAIGLITLTVSITTALTGLGVTFGSAVLAFPVGTVVAIVAVAVVAIGIAIRAFLNRHQQREKERRAFKLINGSPKQDWNRYCNLLDNVEMAVNKAGANLTLYQFSSNDEQEITMAIGGNYYYITFTKTNVYPYWKTDVRLNAPSTKEGSTAISNMRLNFPVVDNFLDLNENINMWFKDESKQYQCYIVNPSLNDAYNKTQEDKAKIAKDLTNYTIWISKGSMKEAVNKVEEALKNAIWENDFD